MQKPNDGSYDELAVYREALGKAQPEEEPAAPPDEPKKMARLTLLAIDEFTHPSEWCINGHPICWKVADDNTEVRLVARYPRRILEMAYADRPENIPASVCLICGEENPIAEATQGD